MNTLSSRPANHGSQRLYIKYTLQPSPITQCAEAGHVPPSAWTYPNTRPQPALFHLPTACGSPIWLSMGSGCCIHCSPRWKSAARCAAVSCVRSRLRPCGWLALDLSSLRAPAADQNGGQPCLHQSLCTYGRQLRLRHKLDPSQGTNQAGGSLFPAKPCRAAIGHTRIHMYDVHVVRQARKGLDQAGRPRTVRTFLHGAQACTRFRGCSGLASPTRPSTRQGSKPSP